MKIKMKIKWKSLILCIAIPLIVGGIAAFISKDSMRGFDGLTQPPLTPPKWLFPAAWTILYTLMGISSYFVLTAGVPQHESKKALKLYGLQLLFNFLWTIWFFNLELYWFAFVWLAVLWILIFVTMISFSRISKPAAYLLIPYLTWVTFAGYLNLGIAILN